MQGGQDFTMLSRQYATNDGNTEPYHAQQNPAENRAIRWLKEHIQIVMNKTGAPAAMWLHCA